mmetsp:Transcript_12731/g.24938  ORF Transcript_12731/g.24938 Transcript_12731/m.24938 type:complete len:363 (+) Transcript_12731:135-1223(+)
MVHAPEEMLSLGRPHCQGLASQRHRLAMIAAPTFLPGFLTPWTLGPAWCAHAPSKLIFARGLQARPRVMRLAQANELASQQRRQRTNGPYAAAMDLFFGAAARGLEAAAAATDTTLALLSLTGHSPQDELMVARSGGFQKSVLTLQKLCRQITLQPSAAARIMDIEVAGRLSGLEVLPVDDALVDHGRAILYFHGGAHCIGSPSLSGDLLGRLAVGARARMVAVDDRKEPKNPFPHALEDASVALDWLRGQFPAASIAVAGDSAGGNLAFALLVLLAQSQREQPVACVALSPWLLLDLDRIPAARRVHRSAGSNLRGGEVLTAVQQLASGQDLRSASGALMSGKMHDVVAAQYFQDHSASNP